MTLQTNTYYSQESQGPYSKFNLGTITLQNGEILKNAYISYATTGVLNNEKSNAVLLPHMYSGTSKHIENFFTGEGRALDPEKYFLIFPNQIGNGISLSPSNIQESDKIDGFPAITIGDDVEAQYKLITQLFGIKNLALVMGWSMGAQQTYEWCVRYPEVVYRAIPIAGTATCTTFSRLFTEVAIEQIISDIGWNDGNYVSNDKVQLGLKRHARLFALMGLSSKFYDNKIWESANFSSYEDFVTNFWESWFLPMDPNNLICMLKKWQHATVLANKSDNIIDVLKSIKAKVDIIAFEDDMMFPIHECMSDMELIPNSKIHKIKSDWGHFSALGLSESDRRKIDNIISKTMSTSL